MKEPPASTDLDLVRARATQIWTPEVADLWLIGTEPFLGGRRPVDVLESPASVRDVLAAIDAIDAGAYA